MKLKLRYPLHIGKIELTELNLRDHTIAADYLAFDQRGGVAQRIALIASVAGTDEEVIKRLRGVDYRRAEAEVDRLMKEDEAEAEGGETVEPAKALEKK